MNGENIKRLRKEFNLSTQDLADRFGISPRTIESWEQGRRPVPKYAKILIPFLFDEDNILREEDFF